jgi:hypothetical protein
VLREINRRRREEVAKRAGHNCEYCLIREEDSGFSHQIDHIISLKHGGGSTVDNLAYACGLSNRHKGADVASIDRHSGGIIRLFHLRRDRWADHFRLDGNFFEPCTEIGAATIRLLRLNSVERIVERRELQELGYYPRR